ncbi:MAG TPA: efflux RND transporter permease subunit [Gemmatimonadaceae bacterium]|nr:efflux RND transporter permease subunit [Gemmatimonadaceae bacterium]
MFLSDVSIKRPVFATMMMVALVVLGIVSFGRLAIDEYPDITYPIVIAQTTYPGASPQVMERDVSRPIEEALNTVQGLKEINSTSLNGVSLVRVTLHLGVDVLAAQQDVQSKIARIRRQLPPEIEEPVTNRFDPNERPIISVAMQSSERPMRELTSLADEVVAPRLQAIAGVGGINVAGGETRQIRVELDPAAMRSYGIGPAQVTQALQRENQEVPAGRVTSGATEQLVRVSGRITNPASFAGIVVAVRQGVPIRLGDVATVKDAAADKRTAALLDATPALALDILKVSGSNTVAVADSVRAATLELEKQLPADVQLRVIRDDSRRIRESLADVELSIVLGAVLTIMIIYLFLNSWRSTIITGLTLPVSIISAFFIMWVFGFTVNTMTLLALSLAIGLLIDDAIVVRENIVRHVRMGKDHVRAAKEGSDEIGLAVLSTTLAVVAVFVPVAFMGGMIGKIFFQFGVTVTFAVLVSLFVSFTLDPMLSSIWPDPVGEGGDGAKLRRTRNPIRRVGLAFDSWFERVSDSYPKGLRWALNHRALVMVAAVASVVVAGIIYPRLGFTWLPDVDGGEFNVQLRTPPGSSLAYTVDKAGDVSAFLRSQPEVEFTYTTIGGGFRGTPNSGQIYVRLVDHGKRDRSQQEIQTELRGKLRAMPGIRPTITGTPSIFGGFRQPIIVNVQGPEETRLKVAANQVLEKMRETPGVAEPNSSDEGQIPELDVAIDRQQAWAAGLGIASIASTLQPLFAGQRATRWEDEQGFSHDVVVVYPDSLRSTAADIRNIVIPTSTVDQATGQPAMVALSQVADVKTGLAPQQIDRRNLQRQVSLAAGVMPGYAMGNVANAVKAGIDSIGLPVGYQAVFTGDVQNLSETKGYVLAALGLAVVFIYLILASLFGSFFQPLAIMLALPLSFIGVALALLLTGGNINVMTMIGIIMLMGLVTKNGILLVDFANQQRATGALRLDSLLSAGRIRLRPIIMTTTAMIFGMMPLALAVGAGAEQRAPMARAVIGGLITSTMLTLFVVPVMYTLLEDSVAYARREVPAVLRRFRSRPASVPVRPITSRPRPVAGEPGPAYRTEAAEKSGTL